MQRPYTNTIHLPYSKWSQHRADNGLIYLSHPVTGEVKWLWSRHHDPKTETDYLVNTVTGDRQWVTEENEHLCPVPTDKSTNQQSNQTTSPSKPQSTNPFTEKRTNRKKPTTNSTPNSPSSHTPKYREIAAPKSLGLSVDEVLMLVPETGRRYIFNKKTNSSRWLPDRPPDTIGPDSTQRSLFGRAKPSKQSSFDDRNDDIHPQLREKTKTPFFDQQQPLKDSDTAPTKPASRTSSAHKPQHNSTNPRSTHTSNGSSYPLPHSRLPSHSNTGSPGHQAATEPSPPASAQTHSNGTNNVDTTKSSRGNDPVTNKLNALDTILANISKMTSGGKYELGKLRRLTSDRGQKSQVQEGSQRLLELEEYLTQQMLKVDAVESEGNQTIRAKRKETVKTILGLTDEIEQLRTKLKSLSLGS